MLDGEWHRFDKSSAARQGNSFGDERLICEWEGRTPCLKVNESETALCEAEFAKRLRVKPFFWFYDKGGTLRLRSL